MTDLTILDPTYKFNEKVIIKDDNLNLINHDENLLIIEDRIVAKQNGFMFINIDDELNIQSMHTLLFS